MNIFFQILTPNAPIPGIDNQWSALCQGCGHFSTHVSRGGPKGVQHCYHCGLESPLPEMFGEEFREGAVRAWSHWLLFPVLPYDWHTKTEAEKLQILGRMP